MLLIAILNIAFLVNNVYCAHKNNPVVQIDQGLVRGQIDAEGFSTFLGIPYAQVDESKPFGPPLPAPSFLEVFDASNELIECPQTRSTPSNANSHEILDCLRLNIFVPSEASSTNLLPVLVFIHGGEFDFESAGLYGARYLVRNGIVVVTINYRLGPYGFMCLNTPSVPGNQGLKDQYEALRWIKNNIAAFGGNPDEVTLSGQGAGASSTILHAFSSKEKLYHKLIVQSGTPQNEGMFVSADLDAARKLAGYLGLNTTNNEEALEFLRKTSYNLVTDAAYSLHLQLKPCRERSFDGVSNFVSTDPFSLSNEVKIRDTPILIGLTSIEHVAELSKYGDTFFENPFYNKIRATYDLEEEELREAAEFIRHFYAGDEVISRNLTEVLEDFDTDFVFNHPMYRTLTVLLEENANPVFKYIFSYVSDTGLRGAPHSAELPYLYETSHLQSSISANDTLIRERVTTIWSNFVKYGNPTPSSTNLLPVIWEPLTKETRPYMDIDVTIQMNNRIYNDRMAFWDLFHVYYGEHNRLIPIPEYDDNDDQDENNASQVNSISLVTIILLNIVLITLS